MKYRRHDLHGLMVMDKPVGPSSMDVVRAVRRAAGHCKTGHAGTLDPRAEGVVICCLGKATKSANRLMAMPKTYRASVDLSAFTPTDDAEGDREPVEASSPPSIERVRAALHALTAWIEQIPPPYSAVKINGQRAYKLARKGADARPSARQVRVDRIDIERYDWPTLEITVACGKGTYIRALARQIGQKLGTGGYLKTLHRTAIGPYTLEHAFGLDALPSPLDPEHLLPIPAPPAPCAQAGSSEGG